MMVSRQPSNQAANMAVGYTGQQLHVSGVFIVLLEIALVVENLLPILVVVIWMPAPVRGVGDRLVAAFSVTCILSALVPTPLGLASYFSGGWYGGAPTCITYQVTSIWCNLSSLALLTYMCVNCNCAMWRLRKITPSPRCTTRHRSVLKPLNVSDHTESCCTSTILPSSSPQTPHLSISRQSKTSTSRHIDHSGSQNDPVLQKNTTNLHVHMIKQNETNMSSNVQHTNSNGECRFVVDNYSERIQSPHNNSSFVERKLIRNCSQMEQECDNDSLSSPCKIGNIKRLGKEQYVHLQEDCLQYDKPNCSTSHVKQFSSSSRNTNLGSLTCLQKTSLLLDESSHITDDLSYNECTSDYNEIGGVMDTSQKRPNPKFGRITHDYDDTQNFRNIVNNDQEEGSLFAAKGCFCSPISHSRDYVCLMLFFMFACTLTISSLPVVGFGPRSTHSDKACRSWLVPIPTSSRERTFYVTFLLFVYTCLALGCGSGISVCLQVSDRMKHERKRKSRLYHEEENVPDIVELSVLDDMKRQYSLTCVVMAGLLTWLPIAVMMTLQKAGVQVSEATLMYSNIATSLPGLLNPLLYSLALNRYRTGYKAIIEKCCPKSRRHKNQRLRGAHQENLADDEASTDTGLDTSTTGHTCIHGRSNPNCDNITEVNAEEYDDDNDDDGFPDDSELLDEERKKQVSKPSEKTPLQSMLVSLPSTSAFRTILANRTKSPWQRQQETSPSSSNDNECLLVSSSDLVNEETGL